MEEPVGDASASELLALDLRVPFPTPEYAVIAYNTLRVDPEPKRSKVTKTLSTDKCILSVKFSSPEARTLRVCVNGFLDHLILVTQTIEKFGSSAVPSGGDA